MEEHSVVDMPQFLVPEFVGRAMYGIFTIVMVIVLLNMLIAMITNSFQKIEVRNPSQARWGGTGCKDPRGPALLPLSLYDFGQILLCTRLSALLLCGQTPSLMLSALFLVVGGGGGSSSEHCIKVGTQEGIRGWHCGLENRLSTEQQLGIRGEREWERECGWSVGRKAVGTLESRRGEDKRD